jgi:uncharacterized membrane protein
MSAINALGLILWVAVVITLVVLARLSQRLGDVTHARHYYRWYYVAACFVAVAILIQVMQDQPPLAASPNLTILGIILHDGFQALGLTIGLIITWYYWSWLLAERD